MIKDEKGYPPTDECWRCGCQLGILAEARAALLAEVLKGINDLSLRTRLKQRNMYATDQQREYFGAKVEAYNEIMQMVKALKGVAG